MDTGTLDNYASVPAQSEPEVPRRVEVAGHQLSVYVAFGTLLADLLRDLAGARRRIWIEMYLFAGDAAGQAIGALLEKKVAEGVDVRVLYDAVGSQWTPTAFFAGLANAGVKVHAYHSIAEALHELKPFSVINRRDHRKLVVIDESVGYFGGMNLINNATADNVHQAKALLPISAGWRDVHVRLEGPQQMELAESFARSWSKVHGEKVARRSRAYRRAALASGEEIIHFFDSGPGSKFSRAGRVLARLFRHSHESIMISMAYFLPAGRALWALLAARKRGVRVRIIVPGQSDVKLVQRATTYIYGKLLKRKFRLYERKNQMLHSKVMVIDRTWTVVGSCNFDPRSLWINLEFLAVIRSAALAEIMLDICRFELRHSERVTEAKISKIGWRERALNWVAWTFRWWL
jgi:cardiolipin synthase